MNNDEVNHPDHYTWLKDRCGIEVIDITRHLDFNLGNVIKYVLRAGRKGDRVTDLKKAMWYLQDEIRMIECSPENRINSEWFRKCAEKFKELAVMNGALENIDEIRMLGNDPKYRKNSDLLKKHGDLNTES